MKRKKPKMALFLNHPECSAQCAIGIYESLTSHYDIELFNNTEFHTHIVNKADIIAIPGGVGDSSRYHTLIGDNSYYIIDAISKGKRYLGICMGAYWAGHHYLDILDEVSPLQYIKRPKSGIQRSFGTLVPVTWFDEKLDMYFYDGCAFIGDEKKFYTVARYKNKDPMAIIQNRIGLIGCHPESMKSWYNRDSMKLKWHENYHHKLLLDFTNLLMQC